MERNLIKNILQLEEVNAGTMARNTIETEEINNVEDGQLGAVGTCSFENQRTYMKNSATNEDSGNSIVKECTNVIATKDTSMHKDNVTIEEQFDENYLDTKTIEDVLKCKIQMLYSAYGISNSDPISNVYDALKDPKETNNVRKKEDIKSHEENLENVNMEHHSALDCQTDSIKSFRAMFKRILRKRISKTKSFSSDINRQPTSQEPIDVLTVLENAKPNGTNESRLLDPSEHLRSNSYIFVGDKEIELMAAAEDGDENEVRRILSHGANVNARDRDYLTALHWAVERGNLEVGSILLEAGADVNAKDVFGCTPLHNTAAFGDAKFAALLIKYGADVNCTNKNGYTALVGAMRNENDDVVRLLLIAGAKS